MNAPRLVVVGFGHHGQSIARTYIEQGGVALGAVDPAYSDTHIRLSPDITVPSIATPAASCDLNPDIALITAPLALDALADMVVTFLDRGIDVVTIHPDAFDPPREWAARIDRHAKAGNARFLATGVQDVWWVHMPAVAAGSTSNLTRILIRHATDLDTLSADLGRLFGVGQPVTHFDAVKEIVLSEAPVLGGPLRVLARRLGLTPGEPVRSFTPATLEQPVRWHRGEADVPAGALVGFTETVEIATEEGITLRGELKTALLSPGEVPSDRVTLEGDPVLHLEHAPFPGARITDIVPVSRIWTLHEAEPGFHDAATLPPVRYHHTPREVAQR